MSEKDKSYQKFMSGYLYAAKERNRRLEMEYNVHIIDKWEKPTRDGWGLEINTVGKFGLRITETYKGKPTNSVYFSDSTGTEWLEYASKWVENEREKV